MFAKNVSISYRIFSFFNILFMLIVCGAVLIPYLNVMAIAFNDNTKTAFSGFMMWPVAPTLPSSPFRYKR